MSTCGHSPDPRYRLLGGEGLRAEVFVPPSDEAMALLRLAPRWTSMEIDAPPSLRRGIRNALVAPFTQLTFLSFDLQYFLFGVFHQTWTARAGHLLGMGLVILFLMAGFSQLTAGWSGFDGGAAFATLLLSWYAAISRDARLARWWLVMLPIVGALYMGSKAFLLATAGSSGPWAQPWLLIFASAFIVSISHGAEPLFPPRAGDPRRWLSVREFVFGPEDQRSSPALAAGRLARVAAYPFIGMLDELWAAPRLFPYTILSLMFRFGYAPAARAVLDDRARRALESGNPAVDFVGIGGGVGLRLDDQVRPGPGSAPPPGSPSPGASLRPGA
jgi:hypothetical protein